ncbi:translation elongation factor Ts [Saccharopolyspora oryzae]|uniref:Elongation factor Ts n=1 Tax=Saccharopolyspora oryzae TaxID=2997343 RepID=A0ABT4V927_9PSEU|nr:translation elongation factor Ts [Saccharopolyspora oryzae]MDA3629807.1 translation elongation factor Ts [Saccharopolyspora oryzae]
MANFSAADVKRLRELTGAGMMDCKKALDQNDGDFDKAVESLRIKGAKDVGKRAERATAEGLVAADGGVLIELNSETDFVAKNDEFIQLANKIAAAARAAGAGDLESALAADLDGKPVSEVIQELSAKIGEKLELRRVTKFDGAVATYLHRRSSDLPPAVGVLVEYTGDDAEAARGAAMQVAALKPKYLSRDDVPEDLVANERRIAEETAKAEGKPEKALPKIVEGRLNGFFKENCLLDQPSVQDNKKTVKALLDEAGVTVTGFARFEVGQA